VGVTDVELAEMEMAELDAAAEDALGWLLSHTEQEQEADLDEMVDYDEFGDDEYAELAAEVEAMVEGSYADIRVGDRVLGTVYEVDEGGAYVELGEKASGFVPLAECSFAKLKTVSREWRMLWGFLGWHAGVAVASTRRVVHRALEAQGLAPGCRHASRHHACISIATSG
jgi:hypothetical protein